MEHSFDNDSCMCPMPDGSGTCGEELYIKWTCSAPIAGDDLSPLRGGPDPATPNDAWVQSWVVECVVGHVLLVPGRAGCQHFDDEAEHPDHGTPGRECDVDGSDEYRTFRRSDWLRLVEVLDRLTPSPTPSPPTPLHNAHCGVR